MILLFFPPIFHDEIHNKKRTKKDKDKLLLGGKLMINKHTNIQADKQIRAKSEKESKLERTSAV